MSVPSGFSLANVTGVQELSPGFSASSWSIVAKMFLGHVGLFGFGSNGRNPGKAGLESAVMHGLL